MGYKRTQFLTEAQAILDAEHPDDEEARALEAAFVRCFPFAEHAATLFQDLLRDWHRSDIPLFGAQVIALFAQEAGSKEVPSWDYDLVEFMIEASKRYRLPLPKVVLEGLPEPTILLVDKTLLV